MKTAAVFLLTLLNNNPTGDVVSVHSRYSTLEACQQAIANDLSLESAMCIQQQTCKQVAADIDEMIEAGGNVGVNMLRATETCR